MDPQKAAPETRRLARQNRAILLTVAAVLVASTFGFAHYTRHVVKSHEARVVAGEFPHLMVERVAVQIQESGEVKSAGQPFANRRFVGSLRLTPPGRYQAILIGHDGVPEHREKSEIILAAQDARGQWHPATASQLLERLNRPSPGTLR